MASTKVLTPSEFQPSSLVFSSLEKTRQGGKQVFVSREEMPKAKVIVQTPALHLPWGITPYQDKATGAIQSFSMDVSFRDAPEFLETMTALDEVMIDACVSRSQDWFGKPMSREIIQDMDIVRKCVKKPSNPQYAPTMRIKVPVINGVEQTRFYDEKREPVDIEYVTKGSCVRVIMELSPVWFLNKMCGVSWKAVQVAVVSKPARVEDYAFVDEGEVGATEM